MFVIPKEKFRIQQTATNGRGVFVNEDIEPGTVIGDYIGKAIKTEEEAEYEKKFGLYSLWLNDNTTIFADPQEIGVHLINTSCMPNCAMYPYQGHVLIVALRRIFSGEELSIAYLLDPLDNESEQNIHPCFCETPICRGTMYVSQEVGKKWEDFFREKQGDSFELKVEPGSYLPQLNSYPDPVGDEDVFDIFGHLVAEPISYDDSSFPKLSEIRKRIRESGKRLLFPQLGVIVVGVLNQLLICENIS